MYIRGDRGKQTAWVYMHCQGNGTEVGFQRYTEAMQQHQAAWKQQRAPFFFFFFLPLSSHLYWQHKMHHGGGVQSVVELLLLGGFGDTNRQSVGPLRAAHMPCRPGSRQALWTGVWHRRDGGATNRTVRRRRGGASARQDGRHLLHHVLGSHGDKTKPSPPFHPNPYSSRSSSTHSPRAHSMVADRRGWWGRGLAALLRLPAPAFRLSALHICRTKATFKLHLETVTFSYIL